VFCHGAASAAMVLYRGWVDLGDSRYLETARKGAAWIAAMGIDHPEGGVLWPHIASWDHFGTGYQTGTASIGHAYLQMQAFDPDRGYVDRARAAARYLLQIADRPIDGQLRWIAYTNAERQGFQRAYLNGWYSGAAGIGLFLLEVADATRR
jgi:hypothetical protein